MPMNWSTISNQYWFVTFIYAILSSFNQESMLVILLYLCITEIRPELTMVYLSLPLENLYEQLVFLTISLYFFFSFYLNSRLFSTMCISAQSISMQMASNNKLLICFHLSWLNLTYKLRQVSCNNVKIPSSSCISLSSVEFLQHNWTHG